jgi:hypothetical protein
MGSQAGERRLNFKLFQTRIYHKLVLLEADVRRDDAGSKYLTLEGPESLNMRKLEAKLPERPKHLTFTSVRTRTL